MLSDHQEAPQDSEIHWIDCSASDFKVASAVCITITCIYTNVLLNPWLKGKPESLWLVQYSGDHMIFPAWPTFTLTTDPLMENNLQHLWGCAEATPCSLHKTKIVLFTGLFSSQQPLTSHNEKNTGVANNSSDNSGLIKCPSKPVTVSQHAPCQDLDTEMLNGIKPSPIFAFLLWPKNIFSSKRAISV